MFAQGDGKSRGFFEKKQRDCFLRFFEGKMIRTYSFASNSPFPSQWSRDEPLEEEDIASDEIYCTTFAQHFLGGGCM